MSNLSLDFILMKLRNFGYEPSYHNDGWNEKIIIRDVGDEATKSAKAFVGRHYPEIKIEAR